MPVTTAFTRDEAIELLEKYKACEKALVDGQAKSYRVGSREFTSLDLDTIAKRINYYASIVDSLQRGARTRRAQTIVPRDL